MSRISKAHPVRDYILTYINGRRHQVCAGDALLTLSDYLRRRCHLTGTKIVCSEGDCGSCTVLVGRPQGERLAYRPVDSCILLMFQLDGAHVVSIEGLRREEALTAVQQAMVDCHGSQCGYCTPGFVVSMTGLLEEAENDGGRLSDEEWQRGLTGNLCRCTGYVPIVRAGCAAQEAQEAAPDGNGKQVPAADRLESLYPPGPMLADFASARGESIELAHDSTWRPRRLFSPASLDEALEVFARHPDAKVVAGATDVGVQVNKGHIDPDVFLDLNRVEDLCDLQIEQGDAEDVLAAGARATWTALEHITRDRAPEFHNIISIFGSPQIRHVGTIGGNVINASPIADSLPFLFVCEAELELSSTSGTRRVNINDFYRGYKEIDLRPGELLTRVRIPLPRPEQKLRLYKVSRRRDLDIATFTAAFLIDVADGAIAAARVAFGAVGPTVIRARRTEAFLRGRPFTEETFEAAGNMAVDEIAPISDVRGSAEYRSQLARNSLLKFYWQHEQSGLVASAYDSLKNNFSDSVRGRVEQEETKE